MSPYDALMAYQRQTEALSQVAGRLGWDQETVMPRGAAAQRAEEMEAMEHVLHARRTDPQIGEWLAAIDDAQLGEVARANLRLIRRSYSRAQKIPAKLAGALARMASEGQVKWIEARGSEDFAGFAPTLAEILTLKREEAAALAEGGDLYDALLDDYEPGADGAQLQAMFDALRPGLVDLRDRILGAAHQPEALTGRFEEHAQMRLTREIAKTFGYDFKRGRIDKAVHPFSAGSGLDVRITTRTAEDDPFNAIYSTIHEVGHACYEQNIDDAYLLTPLGAGVSMGVHESQSRIYENQMGRSRAYTGWLFERMKDSFGALNITDADAFFGAVNRVSRGYVRTESDEVQYNLHVLLRFDLEREMIAGTLAARDLEEAWNVKFEADFGVAVDTPSSGCLQDVHWSAGLFGYFPTYSLGNVYAACLWEALQKDMAEAEDHLSKGEAHQVTAWLGENLQRHGGLYEPREVITRASGSEPSEAPLLAYLTAKFGEIYKL